MDHIATLLAKKMEETNPELNIYDNDYKILQVARQDFINYIKNNNQQLKKETDAWDIEHHIEKILRKKPAETESFLTIWTGIWLQKWKKRIRLFISNETQSKTSKQPKEATKNETTWENLQHKHEMKELIIATLIKNAEICGTEILAENILRTEASKIKNLDPRNQEQMLTMLNNSLRTAREVAQRTGPVISVKIDKTYYCQ